VRAEGLVGLLLLLGKLGLLELTQALVVGVLNVVVVFNFVVFELDTEKVGGGTDLVVVVGAGK
jgi:hypothetical protein